MSSKAARTPPAQQGTPRSGSASASSETARAVTAADSSAPRLIPEGIYQHADRLKRGELPGQVFPGGSAADDERLRPFLEAVAAGDEEQGLSTLAFILEGWPRLLWHPLVRSQVEHLSGFAQFWHIWDHVSQDAAQDALDRRTLWRVRLIEAWARGTTEYDVRITKPAGGRGQTPALFPHLREPRYFFSPQGMEERYAAENFRRAYDDLMARLKVAVSWKAVRNDHREYVKGRAEPTSVVAEVAAQIRPVFEGFCRARGRSDSGVSDDRLQQIVRAGLAVPSRRNPRHVIACALLAEFDWVVAGVVRRVNPGLVESTLETLRKHGIGTSVRSSSRGHRTTR